MSPGALVGWSAATGARSGRDDHREAWASCDPEHAALWPLGRNDFPDDRALPGRAPLDRAAERRFEWVHSHGVVERIRDRVTGQPVELAPDAAARSTGYPGAAPRPGPATLATPTAARSATAPAGYDASARLYAATPGLVLEGDRVLPETWGCCAYGGGDTVGRWDPGGLFARFVFAGVVAAAIAAGSLSCGAEVAIRGDAGDIARAARFHGLCGSLGAERVMVGGSSGVGRLASTVRLRC
jgi:hypothetical protein